MQEMVNSLYKSVAGFGLNLVAALLIFIIGKWLAGVAARFFAASLEKTKVDKTLTVFLRNAVYFGALTFVIIAALGKIGVETTSFVTVIGAAGLAVGLALQGSLSNFAAGVMIILFKPFKVGDMIEAGGAAGNVEEIQIFSTILYSPDKKKIIVPNAKITGDKITILS
ncbi:MAG TPA: mechanosensitive ion channel [Candidatus Omnitrophota bacterium]|nr:mechanosensitive ion channel [Candidatus Omnitrophota bacterium]HPT06947.1 mechanosensitive ion channel [Candidatus Omnitrophota bacterium]